MAKFIAPSQYLSAGDLSPDEDTILTVRSHTRESLYQDGRTKTKPVLYFDEVESGWTVNKGNGKILCDLFGDETDSWVGRKIALYVDPNVEYDGDRVSGIRVRPYLVDEVS